MLGDCVRVASSSTRSRTGPPGRGGLAERAERQPGWSLHMFLFMKLQTTTCSQLRPSLLRASPFAAGLLRSVPALRSWPEKASAE